MGYWFIIEIIQTFIQYIKGQNKLWVALFSNLLFLQIKFTILDYNNQKPTINIKVKDDKFVHILEKSDPDKEVVKLEKTDLDRDGKYFSFLKGLLYDLVMFNFCNFIYISESTYFV